MRKNAWGNKERAKCESCIERFNTTENDSIQIVRDGREDGVAIKWCQHVGLIAGLEWVRKDHKKSLTIVTVFNLGAYPRGRHYVCQLARTPFFILFFLLTSWSLLRDVAFLNCIFNQVTSIWLYTLFSGALRDTFHGRYVPSSRTFAFAILTLYNVGTMWTLSGLGELRITYLPYSPYTASC